MPHVSPVLTQAGADRHTDRQAGALLRQWKDPDPLLLGRKLTERSEKVQLGHVILSYPNCFSAAFKLCLSLVLSRRQTLD